MKEVINNYSVPLMRQCKYYTPVDLKSGQVLKEDVFVNYLCVSINVKQGFFNINYKDESVTSEAAFILSIGSFYIYTTSFNGYIPKGSRIEFFGTGIKAWGC